MVRSTAWLIEEVQLSRGVVCCKRRKVEMVKDQITRDCVRASRVSCSVDLGRSANQGAAVP